ncbi:MAG: hypothetical protein EAZ85_01065 [Bacteroidetes bacterium]|nr:MAG: hypothetical protein EAZ85_01065 [Bacteroidota bacterium]TAG88208.1 MAG: hypothetical protein EAZ20_08990 [Bacteroidota bacterium]
MKTFFSKTIYISVIFFISISHIFAQGYVFKVIASSAETSTPNKSQAGSLKIGTKLQSNDQITISNKGYLALAHAQGGTVQISKAGTWSIKDLETNLAKNQKSLGKKYVDFVIGSVVKNGDVDIHKNPHKFQNVTGSVERAFQNDLVVMLPKVTKLSFDENIIRWHALKGTKNYIIQIRDAMGDPLKEYTTADTTFKLNTQDFKFNEDMINLVVLSKERPKGIKLGDYGFIPFTQNEKKSFQTNYEAFKKENAGIENTAHYKLLEGSFFEENKLILDALHAYEDAAKLSNNEEVYDVALKQFTIRYNIGRVEHLKKAVD